VMAIMLVAGMSQAANVVWSTGAIKTPTAGTGVFGANVGATSGLYLAVVSFYLDNAGAQGDLIDSSLFTVGTDRDTSTANVTSVLNGTTGAFNFAPGVSYWASVYITTAVNNGGSGYWEMQSGVGQFTQLPASNVSINFLTGNNIGGVPLLPTQWSYVPEPTSMALLALGVAALGLRRRNRK